MSTPGIIYDTPPGFPDWADEEAAAEFIRQPPAEYVDNTTNLVLDLARQVANYQAEAEAIKTRINELSDKAARKKGAADRIRKYIGELMLSTDLKKAKDTDYTVSLVARKDKLIVLDESALAAGFWKVSRAVDKSKLIEAWKEGEIPEGCEVQDGGFSATIGKG